MSYIIAIPSYQRAHALVKKTLTFLFESQIDMQRVFIFVASQEEYDTYYEVVPHNLFNSLVIGKLGITAQRNFISNFFPEGQYIVSIDDDITRLRILDEKKLTTLEDVDMFLQEAFTICEEEGMFIWGIYPTDSIMFMGNGRMSTSLKFIIGAFYGFINRKLECLRLDIRAECKEDIEQSILYFMLDGGVIRFNNVATNPCVASDGGLGKDREDRNNAACAYLVETYPDYTTLRTRKNGVKEIRLLG